MDKIANLSVADFSQNAIKDKVYLFISFDLVNSTLFKSEFTNRWASIFENVFYSTLLNILNKDNKLKIWKYIGDEVLFYKEINNFKELNILSEIEKTIQMTEENLVLALNKLTKECQKDNEIPLYIKATTWIANIGNSKNPKYRNIAIETPLGIDFLGSDIDLGFRIAKFSFKSKIVVGAKLAYLLYKYCRQDNIGIVSYEVLKGIWGGRKYPIIWYNPDSKYLYDDKYSSPIVKNIQSNCSIKNNLPELKSIFIDLKKMNQIEEIEEILNFQLQN